MMITGPANILWAPREDHEVTSLLTFIHPENLSIDPLSQS